MKRRVMHLVMARFMESDRPIAGFLLKTDAERHAQLCAAYERTQPEFPSKVEDTAENDLLFTRWELKLKRWQARHPARKYNWGADTYEVQSVPLHCGDRS